MRWLRVAFWKEKKIINTTLAYFVTTTTESFENTTTVAANVHERNKRHLYALVNVLRNSSRSSVPRVTSGVRRRILESLGNYTASQSLLRIYVFNYATHYLKLTSNTRPYDPFYNARDSPGMSYKSRVTGWHLLVQYIRRGWTGPAIVCTCSANWEDVKLPVSSFFFKRRKRKIHHNIADDL